MSADGDYGKVACDDLRELILDRYDGLRDALVSDDTERAVDAKTFTYYKMSSVVDCLDLLMKYHEDDLLSVISTCELIAKWKDGELIRAIALSNLDDGLKSGETSSHDS
jgi:hypothetical protein